MARKMKCRGKGKVRTCTAGGETFSLHGGRKARRSAAHLRKFRFTSSDYKKCKSKNKKAQGACMARAAQSRAA